MLSGGSALVSCRPSGARAADTDAALVEAVGRLTRERPDLFAAFTPLDRAARRAGAGARREPPPGGLRALRPFGKILGVRPEFRWDAGPGLTGLQVELSSEGGRSLWSAAPDDAERLAWPGSESELAPGGHYRWRVEGQGANGPVRSEQLFQVASEVERAAFETARAEVAARVPTPLRSLVLGQFAIGRGLPGQAEIEVRAYLAERPDDPVGRETLFHLLRIQGAAESWSWLEPPRETR